MTDPYRRRIHEAHGPGGRKCPCCGSKYTPKQARRAARRTAGHNHPGAVVENKGLQRPVPPSLSAPFC